MKKTLIAIAALAATAAFAQSSVTIGGQLDAGYSTQKSDMLTVITPAVTAGYTSSIASGSVVVTANVVAPAVTRIVTTTANSINGGNYGASRLWFRGTEDLGGGMAANFELQMQPQLANGSTNANLFNRGAWLGLSGGFGETKIGRQGTSTAGLICGVIDLNGCYGSFFGGGILFSGNGGTPGKQGSAMFQANAQNAWTAMGATAIGPATGTDSTRYERAITYKTPTMGGFNAVVDYAFNGTATTTNASGGAGKTTALGLTYAAGPLSAGFNAQRADIDTNASATASTNTFGAKYNMGAAILSFGYQKGSTANAGNTGDSKALTVGVKMAMGTFAPYAVLSRGAVTVSSSGVTGDVYTSKVFNLGTTYALSKRTDVYADWAKDGGSNGNAAAAYNVNASILSMGLRHNF